MGVANCLILDGPQPKTLRGVVGGLLEAAVVEQQHLRLPVFEEEFAVIGAVEAASDDFGDLGLVEAGAVEQGRGGFHGGTSKESMDRARNISTPEVGSQGSDVRNCADGGDARCFAALTAACRSPVRSLWNFMGKPMPSSGVWKMKKVAVVPERSFLISSSSMTTSA